MQDFSQIQVLLLQWFKHHKERSIAHIRIACASLLASFYAEQKYGLFKVFYPLVRKGFIEFIGDGKYQIAKPSIIYNLKKNIAVGLNLSDETKEKIKNRFTGINEDEYGLIRFVSEKKPVRLFCETENCFFSEPYITEILSNFPQVQDVIKQFERDVISSKVEYYDIERHRWEKNNNKKYGIIRVGEDSTKRYLCDKKYGDLSIPDSSINPESRPLAESYQAGVEGCRFLFYNKAAKELTVKKINIPILIERILRTASLHSPDGIIESYEKTTYKNIPYSAVMQLNRIFGTSATIKT